MGDCPDKSCHESHVELRDFVYGKEPGKGKGLQGWIARIDNCTLKLVPKTWLWKFATAFGLSIIIGIAIFYGGVRMNTLVSAQNSYNINKHDSKIEKLEELSEESNVRQAEVKKDLEQIRDSLSDIKDTIKEILKHQQDNNTR
jgi:septal ring factor EnvC (AmiA/AmiB activator)